MVKIVGKNHAEAYKKQEDRGTFEVPPTGTYHVVNTALQRQTMKTGTERLQVFTHVLACIETENPEDMDEGKKWVGKKVQQSMWWDLSKTGNVERLACMATANAVSPSEEWDTDSDPSCVSALTGVPYQLKIRKKTEEYQGHERHVMDVAATQLLQLDMRKKYMQAPDWKKTVGDPAARMMEKKVFGGGGGGGGQRGGGGGRRPEPESHSTGVQDVDPFADAPFSEG
jgi:hypothetical protein